MSEDKREFKETAVSPERQVALLKKRDMSFACESIAKDRLEQIGFRRL